MPVPYLPKTVREIKLDAATFEQSMSEFYYSQAIRLRLFLIGAKLTHVRPQDVVILADYERRARERFDDACRLRDEAQAEDISWGRA